MVTTLQNEIDELLPGVIADRRWLHEHPELGFEEVQTAAFIQQRLESLGVEDIRTGIAKTVLTALIHGKYYHEETRATFSHTAKGSPAVIVRDLEETKELGRIILGDLPSERFQELFGTRCTTDFDPERDLQRVGVVNQTTMLATETQAIADHLREVMERKYGKDRAKDHFADTRDTLCYATNDNQDATAELLKEEADLALVVGGYNSSNTSHIVEMLENKFPTFFINGDKELASATKIEHFDYPAQQLKHTKGWLPAKRPVTIILTSGASCPDTLLDRVMLRVLGFVDGARNAEQAVDALVDRS